MPDPQDYILGDGLDVPFFNWREPLSNEAQAKWPRLSISLPSSTRRVPRSFAHFAKGRVPQTPTLFS